VIDGLACNAVVITGCGQTTPATLAGPGPFAIAINGATHTAYLGDTGSAGGSPFAISVLNTATCNPDHASECDPKPPVIPMSFLPFAIAVDETTNTIYASNAFDISGTNGDTISVINGSGCDATVTSGCMRPPASVRDGGGPAGLAINHATRTVYVANNADDTLSVVDAATCNATNTAGCGQTPATVSLGASQNGPYAVAVNEKTDTIYVLNSGTPSTVSVLNGVTCNAHVTSGCAQQPPTVTVGNASAFGALGLAVDPATNTIYVDNNGDDTVSVINGAICNSHVTSGCNQTPATVHVGRQHDGFVAVDPTTHLVYVTNTLDENVSVIDGTNCNATVTWDCHRSHPP
jgi:YVTN family beta-propeller protein